MNAALPTTLLTRGNRPLTALENALISSGRPLRWYARRLAERGATPRQLAHTEATLRRYLRNGDAPIYYARRLTLLLGQPLDSKIHDLLLKPRCTWPPWATGITGEAPSGEAAPQDATGTARNFVPDASDAKASPADAGIAARVGTPSRARLPRIERGRMTVLKAI